MKLQNAVINAHSNALRLVKSLIEDPTIICDVSPYIYAIPLRADSYRQYADADVAESVVISTESDAKKYIADNVAPHAWTWELSGYIIGLPEIEKTNLYTPVVALNRLFIRKTFEKGLRIRFKDIYNKVWDNVVIQSLDFSTDADCRGYQPFKMTLKKIDTLSSHYDKTELGIELAEVAAGSIAGAVVSFGTTGVSAVTGNIGDVFSFASGF